MFYCNNVGKEIKLVPLSYLDILATLLVPAVKPSLEKPRKAHRGGRNIALVCSWALNGGDWLTPHPDRFTSGKETHFTRSWVGPRARWMGTENLVPTGIRPPDREARSESLYWRRGSEKHSQWIRSKSDALFKKECSNLQQSFQLPLCNITLSYDAGPGINWKKF